MIGCAELMQYVCTACVRGRHWRGRDNWLVTDNMNTKDWIHTRYSKVPEIQFLLRVMTMAEGLWGFSTTAVYARTYHNVLADRITREDWQAACRELIDEGWTEIKVEEPWKFFLAEGGLRVSKEDEEGGVDLTLHDESAYDVGFGGVPVPAEAR